MFVRCGSMSQRKFILAILVQFVALGHMWTSQCNTTCTKKLPVDAGLDGHRHCQSRPISALSARPFESVVGTLEVLNMEFSVVLWRRGVPVGVVYAGNNAMFRS